VAVRLPERSTFSSAFRGKEPTGRSFEVVAMEWFVLRISRIERRWGPRNSAAQASQIGLQELVRAAMSFFSDVRRIRAFYPVSDLVVQTWPSPAFGHFAASRNVPKELAVDPLPLAVAMFECYLQLMQDGLRQSPRDLAFGREHHIRAFPAQFCHISQEDKSTRWGLAQCDILTSSKIATVK
jgi:hypothetical protein